MEFGKDLIVSMHIHIKYLNLILMYFVFANEFKVNFIPFKSDISSEYKYQNVERQESNLTKIIR